MDRQDLAPGAYYLQATRNGEQQVVKVVVTLRISPDQPAALVSRSLARDAGAAALMEVMDGAGVYFSAGMPVGTIDLSALENLFEGDRARVREWITIYLEEAPPLFRKLAECQESGDATGLVSLAHDLRPLAYYLGVPRVLDLLSDIGQHARTGGAATCDALVRELITFNGNAEAELRAFAAQP